MKASLLRAIGAVTFAVSFIIAGTLAPSPAFVHKSIRPSEEERGPTLCLIGTEKCSARNNPPKICSLDAMSRESCPTDKVKIIDADLR